MLQSWGLGALHTSLGLSRFDLEYKTGFALCISSPFQRVSITEEARPKCVKKSLNHRFALFPRTAPQFGKRPLHVFPSLTQCETPQEGDFEVQHVSLDNDNSAI